MDKFFVGVIAFMVLFISFVFYIAGIPRTEYYHFQESKITCRKWTEHWSYKLDKSECYYMVEAKVW